MSKSVLLFGKLNLNESRLKVINMAFDKMDKNGDGVVMVDDLKLTYNVRFHPAYINGLYS